MSAPRINQLLADQQSPTTERQDLEVLLRRAAAVLITKSPELSLPEEPSAAGPAELLAGAR
jgi:hypothetical protein